MKVFLDTHAAVFLYIGEAFRFGPRSRKLLEEAELVWSPAVRLELAYLRERNRLTVEPDAILGQLSAELGAIMADDPFASVVDRAMTLSWTRDPFDRLIVANALLHDDPLITQDQPIRDNCSLAVW